MSWQPDMFIGTFRPWPDSVLVIKGNYDETQTYIPERTAARVRVPYKGHTSLGHYECECGQTIDAADAWCRACGARIRRTEERDGRI